MTVTREALQANAAKLTAAAQDLVNLARDYRWKAEHSDDLDTVAASVIDKLDTYMFERLSDVLGELEGMAQVRAGL